MNRPKFFKSGSHSSEKRPQTVTGTMLDVIIALIPAAFAGVSVFGSRAAAVIALCIAGCVLSEYLWTRLMKRPASTGDLSAVVTGLMLAFSLPVAVPLWICPIGSVIAIILVKQLFGGEGKSFLNPALTARIVLLLIFAGGVSSFTTPARNAVDALSVATPLAHLNAIDLTGNVNMQLGALISDGKIPNIVNMLFGVRAGCIGEACAPALILGAVFLALRGIINLTLPCVYIGTAALFIFAASGFNVLFTVYELLGGALLLGAFFTATDPSTTPKKLLWRILLGAGAGIITAVIRLFTPLPEGVAYSVLLINVACIFIEKKSIKLYIKLEKSEETSEAESSSEPLAEDDAPVVPTDSMPEQSVDEEESEAVTEEATEAVTEEATEAVAEEETEAVTEKATVAVTEEATEAVAEEETEAVTEEVTEAVTEEVTEAVTEEATEVVTEEATEAVTEEATEAVTEEATEAVAEEETEAVTEEATVAVTEEETEAVAEEETEAVTEEVTEAVTEEVTEAVTEEATEAVTEEATEAVTEEATEAVTEEATEAVTEEETEAVTEEVTEAVTEEVTEAVTEEVTEAASIPEIADPPAKTMLVNKLSPDTDFEPKRAEKKKKKLGRKAKKKEKVMPDFSEPLPDVIPAFLRKEIEKNNQSKS